MTRTLIGPLLALLAAALLGGCSSQARPSADYVLVYLRTGPAKPPPEQSAEIFKGHMANIHRLADEHKLDIAGPFDHARDKSWRGIFVLDTPSLDTAREWTATDPGMNAGVFIADLRPISASTSLRQTLELEKQLSKKEAKPGDPPPNVRGYVMLTTDDAERAATAIANSPFAGKTVWCARFRDSVGGVFVLDAARADDVARAFPDEGIDGWWSSLSLMSLPADARVLP